MRWFLFATGFAEILFSGSVSQVAELYVCHFIYEIYPAILQVFGCSGILLLSRLGNLIPLQTEKNLMTTADCSHAKHFP